MQISILTGPKTYSGLIKKETILNAKFFG
jgi:hypothetical protein